jgi:rhomboid protease GluP
MKNPPRQSTLCSNCRKLISTQDQICPHCGVRRPALYGPRSWVRRLLTEDLVEAAVIICVAVYLLHLGLTFIVDREALFSPSSFFDIGGPSWRVSMLAGGTHGSDLTSGRPWTLITASFVHLNLLHIGFNMMWLMSLGRAASALWGTARFVIVFTLTGIGGFLLSNIMWGGPTAGASCALFGLMGSLATFGYRRGGTVGEQIKQSMVRWVVLAVLISFGIGGINHFGHAGGLFTGIALGFWVPRLETREAPRWVELAALACIAATVVSLGAVLVEWHLYSPEVFRTG